MFSCGRRLGQADPTEQCRPPGASGTGSPWRHMSAYHRSACDFLMGPVLQNKVTLDLQPIPFAFLNRETISLKVDSVGQRKRHHLHDIREARDGHCTL